MCAIRFGWLLNHRIAYSGASRFPQQPFPAGPAGGSGWSDSPRDVAEWSVAGLGFARSTRARGDERPDDGDLDLRQLCAGIWIRRVRWIWSRIWLRAIRIRRRIFWWWRRRRADPSRRARFRFRGRSLLRSVLLFLYSAEHSVSVSDGYFRKRTRRLLPIIGRKSINARRSWRLARRYRYGVRFISRFHRAARAQG